MGVDQVHTRTGFLQTYPGRIRNEVHLNVLTLLEPGQRLVLTASHRHGNDTVWVHTWDGTGIETEELSAAVWSNRWAVAHATIPDGAEVL